MKIPGFSKYGLDELAISTISCFLTAASIIFLAAETGISVISLLVILPAAGWLLALWFFRDPEREIPDGPGVLISPADGVVNDIEENIEVTFLPEGVSGARRLGIFMSPLNVHVNRFPCRGEVVGLEYHEGECLPAFRDNASERNEKSVVTISPLEPAGAAWVQLRQISGAVARRIVCPVKIAEQYRRGQRFGMIKFGSRVEVLLPPDSDYEWTVGIGDKVAAGETIIARRKSG